MLISRVLRDMVIFVSEEYSSFIYIIKYCGTTGIDLQSTSVGAVEPASTLFPFCSFVAD